MHAKRTVWTMGSYIPLLKAKEGEFRALARLTADVKDGITPLLDAPPLDGYGDLEPPDAPTVDTALNRLPQKLEQAWGQDRRFFLDLGLVDCDPALAGGEQPLTFVFGELRGLGLLGLPVTALGRDPNYTAAVGEVCAADGRGLCFRVTAEDLEDPEAAIQQVLTELSTLEIEPDDCDLVIDLGALGDRVGPNVAVADLTLRDLAERDRWRTLTLASTAFPDVSAYGPDSVNTAQRLEWRLWQRVLERQLPRAPDFGDYGIFGIQSIGSGAPQFGPSPNLRYTAGDEWLIFKARAPRYGFDQFNALCASLVNRPEFAGSDFSWADRYIADCAAGTDGPGNGTTWIQVGTNHHLTAVVDQLANLGGP